MNGGKSGQMALQTRPHLQNQAIGWLQSGCRSFASVWWYDFHEFGGYLGNVGFHDTATRIYRLDPAG